MNNEGYNYDISIVGGGPNGLFALYKLSKTFPGKKIILIEKGEILNNLRKLPDVLWHSKMSELKLPSYLNSQIDNDLTPTTSQLIDYYIHYSSEHELNTMENHEVIDIVKQDNDHYYKISMLNNNVKKSLNSKVILLCTGIYENKIKLNINTSFNYVKYEMNLNHQNKKLLLVGGGNSAVDFIIYLLPKNKITWVIRNNSWSHIFSNLLPVFEKIINKYSKNLTIYTNTQVKTFFNDNRVLLSNNVEVNEIDECGIFIGYNSRNNLFEKIGLEYNFDCLKLNKNYSTNMKNIYAFGSVMSEWGNNAPKPTFIHNGNPLKLNNIIQNIIKEETKMIFSDLKLFLDSIQIDKVMIVVHPDDEVLWGSNALENEDDWLVICLTNGENHTRSTQFNDAMDLYGVERLIWNFPDRSSKGFNKNDLVGIQKELSIILNQDYIKKVVTHNPDGEYGHPAHKAISQLIYNIIEFKEKLYYFNFDGDKKEISLIKKQALKIYFPEYSRSFIFYFFRNLTLIIKKLIKSFFKYLRTRKIQITSIKNIFKDFLKPPMALSDLEHIKISKYENIVKWSNYQIVDQLLDETYTFRKKVKNANDVYEKYKELLEEYPDRKFIICDYLPSCEGKTLSVGCHWFNKDDAFCLSNPKDFETIEIEPAYGLYGSPFKHYTGDFLKLKPDYKYNHILLFGVLGIPNLAQDDSDNYSMYGLENDAITHADHLLSVGGTILLGPDISLDISRSKEDNINIWEEFIIKNKIIIEKYQLVNKFVTQTNFIIIIKKNKH